MSSTLKTQARSKRYASLRAAQRTLGEMLHPAELQQALEQGRSIRSRLQALSELDDESETSLRQVDRLLDRLSADTLSMLLRVGFSEGRGSRAPRPLRVSAAA